LVDKAATTCDILTSWDFWKQLIRIPIVVCFKSANADFTSNRKFTLETKRVG
jgi:hypothetical protein